MNRLPVANKTDMSDNCHIILSDDEEIQEIVPAGSTQDEPIVITGSRQISQPVELEAQNEEDDEVLFVSQTTRPPPQVSEEPQHPRPWARRGQASYFINNGDGRIRLRTPRPHNNRDTESSSERILRLRNNFTSRLQAYLQFMQNISGIRVWSSGDNAEDQELLEALMQSAQVEQNTPQLLPEDLKHPTIPSQTRPGYTRGITKSKQLICSMCDLELGIGIPDSDKNYLLTEGDRLFSKRVFFAKCGHVYCGRCVNSIINRERKRGAAKECVVAGCKQSFKKQRTPFREIYY